MSEELIVDKQVEIQPEKNDLSQMSNKDIKWRARYKEAVSELESLKASEERRYREVSEKISAVEQQREAAIQKRIDAELKASAVNAGLTDLDLIKLINKDKISIDQSGDPVGIDEVVNEFKGLKPAYFAEAKKTSSSTNTQLVSNVPPVKTSVWGLSSEEFKSKMKQFGA
ncbi:hypothetical protein UFOVP459_27 [uncultured Caudovirales phage]|uniref:Scaffold protein n=3 Tax=uncultured Caudovirales phage TaxID=2100421 RepID=A0A6J5MGS8_9CAUD|nr:hypothetical protein UFOVP459_27 [uncultured Caudovirales phage]CAB4183400.1 hypothetical protein UFOVP1089_58 [uncultured Caudovirales phage]